MTTQLGTRFGFSSNPTVSRRGISPPGARSSMRSDDRQRLPDRRRQHARHERLPKSSKSCTSRAARARGPPPPGADIAPYRDGRCRRPRGRRHCSPCGASASRTRWPRPRALGQSAAASSSSVHSANGSSAGLQRRYSRPAGRGCPGVNAPPGPDRVAGSAPAFCSVIRRILSCRHFAKAEKREAEDEAADKPGRDELRPYDRKTGAPIKNGLGKRDEVDCW